MMEALLHTSHATQDRQPLVESINLNSKRLSLDVEALLENAFVVERRGTLRLKYPCTAEDALYYALGSIIDISAFFKADNSAVLGHIQATLECSSGKASLSLSRVSAPVIVRHTGWEGSARIDSCQISVKVLSLTQTEVPVEYLVERILT